MVNNTEWQLVEFKQKILKNGHITQVLIHSLLDIELVKYVRALFQNTEDNEYKTQVMSALELRENELKMIPKWNISTETGLLHLCNSAGETISYGSQLSALIKQTRLELLGYDCVVSECVVSPGSYSIMLISHPSVHFTEEYIAHASKYN